MPPADARALADALGTLVRDRALRERMGRAARERVLGGFTTAQVQAAIRDAYDRLLATGAREPL